MYRHSQIFIQIASLFGYRTCGEIFIGLEYLLSILVLREILSFKSYRIVSFKSFPCWIALDVKRFASIYTYCHKEYKEWQLWIVLQGYRHLCRIIKMLYLIGICQKHSNQMFCFPLVTQLDAQFQPKSKLFINTIICLVLNHLITDTIISSIFADLLNFLKKSFFA